MLAGFARRDPYSTEGAIKYFLLGSFSSAILLFGLAYVWGMTGTTRVDGVSSPWRRPWPTGRSSRAWPWALAFMTAGVAFKMAAVPFHYWTPDAYQGSPTPVTAYLLGRAQGRRIRNRPAAVRSALSARSRPTGCRS